MNRVIFHIVLLGIICLESCNYTPECYTFRGMKMPVFEVDTFYNRREYVYYWGQTIDEVKSCSFTKDSFPRSDTYANFEEPSGCEGNQILLYKSKTTVDDSIIITVSERFYFIDSMLFKYQFRYETERALDLREYCVFRHEIISGFSLISDSLDFSTQDSMYLRLYNKDYGLFVRSDCYSKNITNKIFPFIKGYSYLHLREKE